LFFLGFPNSIKDLEDRVKNELVKGTLEGLAFVLGNLSPLLGSRVEVVVTL
jgi:hypothetical protein